jgi:hypothetical protein
MPKRPGSKSSAAEIRSGLPAARLDSAKQPVREALMDLNTDAGEMNNRASDPACRAQIQEGRRLLKEWYAAHDLKLDPQYVVEE